MNNAQRRLLEEAAKFGGKNVSKAEKMAGSIPPIELVDEAYAPNTFPLKDIIGGFIEKSKKKRFEYRKSTNEWGKKNGYPHEVFVGPDESKGQTRPALVKGTVCYIVVDEGADGKPVVEKWAITKHWTRAAEGVEEALKAKPKKTAGIPRLVVDGKVVAMGSKQSLVKLAKEKHGGLKSGKVFLAHTNKTVGQSWKESVEEAREFDDAFNEKQGRKFKAGDRVVVSSTGQKGTIVRFDPHASSRGIAVIVKTKNGTTITTSENQLRKEDVEETGETLDELHYRKATDKPLLVPPKWAYDSFFKRLKKSPKSLFNQLKAEEALESVYSAAVFGGKNDLGGKISGDWGKIYANAELKYKRLMGMKEEAEETGETLEEVYRIGDPRLYDAAKKVLLPKYANDQTILDRMVRIMWDLNALSRGKVKLPELARMARVKLGLNEEVENDIEEALLPKEGIEALRAAFGRIKKINPDSPEYKKLLRIIDKMDPEMLKQVASANIPFVSGVARNRVTLYKGLGTMKK
jgi:hypothetical protein